MLYDCLVVSYIFCYLSRLRSSTLCAGPPVFPAFPYEPYLIQQDFMQALYETIDAGQIGLFESPTGAASECADDCQSRKKSVAMLHIAYWLLLCRNGEDPEPDLRQLEVAGGPPCS